MELDGPFQEFYYSGKDEHIALPVSLSVRQCYNLAAPYTVEPNIFYCEEMGKGKQPPT